VFFKKYGIIIGSVVCVGLLGVAVVMGIIWGVTRPKQVVQVAAPAAAASGEAMHTLIGGSPTKEKALATLKVLEGPRGLIGETFNITKAITIIGRNPKVAHIVFYPDEPSSVSRLHCTIQLDGKQFIITDNNSSSGSRINGDWLKPNDPVQLRDGDEIILGDLAKLGVKLVFHIQAAAESKEAIDRTFIVDDFNQDEFNKFKE
jgi:pSer/pThr/pTyr-binding forkhead associated (FHA) protein